MKCHSWTRITLKIACMIHKCLHSSGPPYLKDLISLAPSASDPRNLRSQAAPLLHQPVSRTSNSGAFSHIGPRVWNKLSDSVRASDDYARFRGLLKTELFQ